MVHAGRPIPLSDFKERGTRTIEDFHERAARGRWGTVSNCSILGSQRVREMEDQYIPLPK